MNAVLCLLFICFSNAIGSCGLTVVEGEALHDFGTVARNQSLKYALKIRNDGDSVVSIREAQTSCGGCSAVRFGSDRVPPGQDVEATIRVNSGNRKGAQTQHIILQATDGRSTSTLELSVHWTVKAYLECIPEAIDLSSKLYSTTQDYQITLDAQGLTTPVQIRSVTCPSPHVRIQGVEASGENQARPASANQAHQTNAGVNAGGDARAPGGRQPFSGSNHVIRLSVLPTIPVGDFETSVTIRTDSPLEPLLYVPIKGKIAGPFIIERPYVNFGVVPAGRSIEQTVTIGRRIASERITGLEYDHGILECALTSDTKSFTVLVKTQSGLSEGMHRTTLKLKTT